MFKDRTNTRASFVLAKEDAFSLLEMLVAISILAFVLTAFHSSLSHASTSIKNAEIKSEAQIAGQQVLDLIRLSNPAILPDTITSDAAENIIVGNTTYQVVATYCRNENYCPPITTNDTRHVAVDVYFNNELIFEVESVYTKLN